MKKRTIVIASILKPVDDTRMFEKFGVSLSDAGGYNVVIIGYPSIAKISYPKIEFKALKPFKRLSLKRMLAPLQVLKKLYQVNHDILIVNTHELLIVALLDRILFGGKIAYDIQENYYRNILFTSTYPKLLRPLLAWWVRAKEKITAPFFHWFFLAEKGYEKEFDFTGKRKTILENKPKSQAFPERLNSPGKLQLLFSGTLAESTGVFDAIHLAKSLHSLDKSVTFHIIGYAAHQQTCERIQDEIREHDFIRLTGGSSLVPHIEILTAIANSDFGIINYPPSPHTENSMPTKLYEYVASKLPILLQDHKQWIEYCQQFQAAIVLEKGLEPTDLLSLMKSRTFYTNTTSIDQVSWTSEEPKLLEALSKLK